eukprot:CAMPEP_0119031466 /NCGR_PEP_ID=MMETSP1176-20130426/41558_1 /TAXON_ID=265551 /ORGANISM="Synedropsis recta cf, Strain CCMP1620" /LENGTH=274 /DNA_ID=CAMNT_0006987861 /DNA_START=159 /DNA_END=982 /DNA_ORIENTATION=+
MPVFSLIDVNVNVVDGTTPALTTKKEKNATATASIDDISPTKRKKIAQDSAQLFGETSSPARPAKKSKNHIVADSSGSDSDDDSAEELDGYRRLLGIFERELTGAAYQSKASLFAAFASAYATGGLTGAALAAFSGAVVVSNGVDMNALGAFMKDIQGDVVELQINMKDLQGDVVELKINVKEIQGDVVELKINMKEIQGDVAELKINMKEVQGDVAELKSDVKTIMGQNAAILKLLENQSQQRSSWSFGFYKGQALSALHIYRCILHSYIELL